MTNQKTHVVCSVGLLLLTGLAAARAWLHTGGQNRGRLLLNTGIGSLVFLLAAAVFIVAVRKKKPVARNYVGGLAVAAAIVVAIPIVGTEFRIEHTKQYLEQRYTTIAENGPPFPDRLPPSRSPSLLISHGYWVSEDRQRFEVYYHVSSDSFALSYPDEHWEWQGYKYQGPAPKDIKDSNL